MGSVRFLILLLLLNSFHTALAAVPGQYSPNSEEQGVQQDLKVPIHPQYANLIAEKQAARTVSGYDPDIRPFTGPTVLGSTLISDSRKTLVFQYLRKCRNIPLKLPRHEIALTFHSFP